MQAKVVYFNKKESKSIDENKESDHHIFREVPARLLLSVRQRCSAVNPEFFEIEV